MLNYFTLHRPPRLTEPVDTLQDLGMFLLNT